jgi:hypothetical protein
MECSPAVEGGEGDQNPAGGGRPRCAGRRRAAVVLRHTSGNRERRNEFVSARGSSWRSRLAPTALHRGKSRGGRRRAWRPGFPQGGGPAASGRRCRARRRLAGRRTARAGGGGLLFMGARAGGGAVQVSWPGTPWPWRRARMGFGGPGCRAGADRVGRIGADVGWSGLKARRA